MLHNYYVRDRRPSTRRGWFGRPRELSSSHLHDAGLGIVWTNSQDVRPGEPHQVSVPALQLVAIVEPGVLDVMPAALRQAAVSLHLFVR